MNELMDSKTLAEKDAEFISNIIKKDLDEWLNEVDYTSLTVPAILAATLRLSACR